jgi:hypothetical protein
MLLHTSEDRWQAAELAALGRCFMCGRRDNVVNLPDAMSPEFRACPVCVEKFGKRKLTREADELLGSLSDPKKREAFAREINEERRYYCSKQGCGAELLATAQGEIGFFCHSCWQGIVASLRNR